MGEEQMWFGNIMSINWKYYVHVSGLVILKGLMKKEWLSVSIMLRRLAEELEKLKWV